MAELLQDAAAALLLPPPAGVALMLLLLELSLAQPARPVLAASTAIAAIAATVICLIPASSPLPARSRELLSRTGGRVPRRPRLRPRGPPAPRPRRCPSPIGSMCRWSGSYLTNVPSTRSRGITALWQGRRGWL